VVIIGDRKGRVGYGIDKGKDVQIGVEKAVNQAKKNVITVPIVRETIPHSVAVKYKSANIILMPAPRGSGIIAGGAVRSVLEMAGVPNVSAKILSRAKNKMNNIKATMIALQSFKLSQKKAKKDIHEEMAQAEVKATDNTVVTKADEAAPVTEVDTLKKKEKPPVMMKKGFMKK
jgi:small subunit ribosomal protein S5